MKKPDAGDAAQQLNLDIGLSERAAATTSPEPIPERLKVLADTPISDQPATVEPSEKAGEQATEKEPLQWQSAYQISGAAAIAAMVLLIVASLQMENPTAGIPENFRVTDVTPADPILRTFPDFAMPANGERIQVGLFSRLSGAESHQTELTRLGLLPHIEKRSSGEDTLYAVMLGPLAPGEHKKVTQILNEHNLRYFHKPKRGS